MTNIYEFGSSVDIILRVKTDKNIGGIDYQAGQIYTILEDCAVGFSYLATNAQLAAKKPIFNGDVFNLVENIVVSNVPVNSKVANLIFTYGGAQQFEKTIVEQVQLSGEISYLKYEPSSAIFVTNSRTGELLAAEYYTIDGDTIRLNSEDYAGNYFVQYKTNSTGSSYGLESDYFGYFDIEIHGKGNINKVTKDVYIFFPAVKITQTPQINLDNEGACSTPFVFNVIYQGQKSPVIMFED